LELQPIQRDAWQPVLQQALAPNQLAVQQLAVKRTSVTRMPPI